MAAINQPGGPALTVRDAAAACRLSPRTIRRKLTTGSFPNAYKTGANGPERDPGLRSRLATFGNVSVTEGANGDGFYEAIVSTLVGGRD